MSLENIHSSQKTQPPAGWTKHSFSIFNTVTLFMLTEEEGNGKQVLN